ncbi:MAG: hypothetical protein ABSH53_07630 [Holophaga sp.]|jgi:hypothetical protein
MIDGADGEAWPVWRQILLDFQHACRQVHQDARGILCCTVPAQAGMTVWEKDINLTVELLDSWVGEADLLEFALHHLQGQRVPHALLFAQVAAAIALWDLALLGAILVELESACFEDPMDFLLNFAATRGWTNVMEPTCASGGRNPRTGMVHSCFLALNGAWKDLESRCWSGQIGHLLPLLEQCRRGVLLEAARHIQLPVTNQWGEWCTSRR